MDLELVRYAYLPNVAVLGSLRVGADRFATLERPWRANAQGPGGVPRESCIPDGRYGLRPWNSPTHGAVYLLSSGTAGVYPTEVPAGQAYGRTLILLHAANEVAELLGCIAPGMRAGVLGGKHWVYESRRALAAISEHLGRVDVHSLTIRTTAGTEEREP